ncbi:hypothetical protein DB347_14630 [Opitutaceae bacterium EW11]|nr:hypothetical protein DB347_14630 [Opitutaceae bacterium EW11]
MANLPSVATKARWVWFLFLGATSLFPFLYYQPHFAKLFWFGDELDLINQIDNQGMLPWLSVAFAENFVPLFKALWGGMIFAGHGSYAAMLWIAWLTHALNVVLLAAWMFRAGFGRVAVCFACLIWGLSATNLETLTWSVQWSAILALTFFLGAVQLETLAAARDVTRRNRWARVLAVTALCAASALAFSRGVLTGAVAAALRLDPTARRGDSWQRRLFVAAIYLVPSVVVAVIILRLAPSSHRGVLSTAERLKDMTTFSVWYFSLNPVAPFFAIAPANWGIPHVTWAHVCLLGALKILVMAVAFRTADVAQRRVFVPLLLLDLSNALLLGYGRGGEDHWLAMSSRYQYNALLCYLPFLAVLVSRLCDMVPRHRGLRAAAVVLLLAVSSWEANRRWADLLPPWCDWRGASNRRLLFETKPLPPGNSLIGIPFLSNARGRELADKYHLH